VPLRTRTILSACWPLPDGKVLRIDNASARIAAAQELYRRTESCAPSNVYLFGLFAMLLANAH
jgi:hypothetical protein